MKTKLWQRRVIELEEKYPDWSVRDIAEEIGCSPSRVSTDLNLAAALRVYPQLEHIVNYVDAVKYLKKRKFRRSIDV